MTLAAPFVFQRNSFWPSHWILLCFLHIRLQGIAHERQKLSFQVRSLEKNRLLSKSRGWSHLTCRIAQWNFSTSVLPNCSSVHLHWEHQLSDRGTLLERLCRWYRRKVRASRIWDRQRKVNWNEVRHVQRLF